MSLKIIINTYTAIHPRLFLVSHINWSPAPFDFPIVLFNGVSVFRICRKKFNASEKIWYWKMCFQFSFALFSIIFFFGFLLSAALYDDVHVLLFDKLHLNQTSFYSQSVLCVDVCQGTVFIFVRNIDFGYMERYAENYVKKEKSKMERIEGKKMLTESGNWSYIMFEYFESHRLCRWCIGKDENSILFMGKIIRTMTRSDATRFDRSIWNGKNQIMLE